LVAAGSAMAGLALEAAVAGPALEEEGRASAVGAVATSAGLAGREALMGEMGLEVMEAGLEVTEAGLEVSSCILPNRWPGRRGADLSPRPRRGRRRRRTWVLGARPRAFL